MARKPASEQLAQDLLGVVGELVADRQHAHLLGGQPEREGAGEVLDQDAHEPLHASRTGRGGSSPGGAAWLSAPMYSRLEALGQVVVELHGAELPLAADAVADDEVDLRARRTRPRPAPRQ